MKIKHGMILAAGLGKRMRPIALKIPKPLIQIGKKNLLNILLREFILILNVQDCQDMQKIVLTSKHLNY